MEPSWDGFYLCQSIWLFKYMHTEKLNQPHTTRRKLLCDVNLPALDDYYQNTCTHVARACGNASQCTEWQSRVKDATTESSENKNYTQTASRVLLINVTILMQSGQILKATREHTASTVRTTNTNNACRKRSQAPHMCTTACTS